MVGPRRWLHRGRSEEENGWRTGLVRVLALVQDELFIRAQKFEEVVQGPRMIVPIVVGGPRPFSRTLGVSGWRQWVPMMRTMFRLHVEAPSEEMRHFRVCPWPEEPEGAPSWAAGVGRDGKEWKG